MKALVKKFSLRVNSPAEATRRVQAKHDLGEFITNFAAEMLKSPFDEPKARACLVDMEFGLNFKTPPLVEARLYVQMALNLSMNSDLEKMLATIAFSDTNRLAALKFGAEEVFNVNWEFIELRLGGLASEVRGITDGDKDKMLKLADSTSPQKCIGFNGWPYTH